MRNYVIIFSIAYFFFTALLAFLLPAKIGNAAVNLVALMAASFFAASAFTRDNGRAPTDEEKSGFARGALFAAVVISLALIILLAGYIFPDDTFALLKKGFSSPLFVCLSAFLAIALGYIYYFAIKWAFSWYAWMAAR